MRPKFHAPATTPPPLGSMSVSNMLHAIGRLASCSSNSSRLFRSARLRGRKLRQAWRRVAVIIPRFYTIFGDCQSGAKVNPQCRPKGISDTRAAAPRASGPQRNRGEPNNRTRNALWPASPNTQAAYNFFCPNLASLFFGHRARNRAAQTVCSSPLWEHFCRYCRCNRKSQSILLMFP